MIVQGFLDLGFGPVLKDASWSMDLLIGPLHKLVFVVAARTMFFDVQVSLGSLFLIESEFLFIPGRDDPVT